MLNKKSIIREGGFTLMESLLVVGLLSGIMLVLVSFMQDYMQREYMRGVADNMALVQRAVNDSVDTVEKFDALYTMALDNGGVAELSILDVANPRRTMNYATTGNTSLETGTADIAPSSIINASFTPGGTRLFSQFSDTLAIRAASYVPSIGIAANNLGNYARLTVLVRVADDPLNSVDERALEILIVTIDRLAEKSLRQVTAVMGANGGMVSSLGNDARCSVSAGCAGTARGAYGNWYIGLANFAGTYWYDNIAVPRPANNEVGYLASYAYINEAVLAGDYLYRVAVPGNPKLNTMHTALNLGGHNIVGVDNIEITASGSAPALTVHDSVYAQGSVFVGSSARITGDLVVNGNMRSGAVTVNPSYNTATILPPAHGNIVANNVTTNNLTTSGDVAVRDSADLKELTSAQASTKALSFKSMDVSSGMLVQDLENAGNIYVNQETQVGTLQTKAVRAERIGVVQGQVTGGLSAEERVNMGSGKVSVTGRVALENLIQCTQYCY